MPVPVILIHGWSVTNTDTYGELPLRLQAMGAAGGLEFDIRNIWLSKYVSFHDEVRLRDIAHGMEAAIRAELGDLLAAGQRFVVITHSTGGPVARDWWQRFYRDKGEVCPMSHLIMLAPANFGSALAQLGKAKVGRMKSFFAGVEPGAGVLDWLELASPESWQLNLDWIRGGDSFLDDPQNAVFPFVLTGQSIDHAIYDHVNSYTGEMGSDGVVRAAAANLNATYVKLVQEAPSFNSRGRAN
ncbi:MAG: esterase/lipase family protein, partial [Rhodospirillales bacterium]